MSLTPRQIKERRQRVNDVEPDIYETRERLYTESEVKELLSQQRELCAEAWLGSVEVGAQKVANIIRNAVLTI